MIINGCARVCWEQMTPYKLVGNKALATKEYTNTEEYMTKQKYIAGPFETNATPEFAAGSHTFNFCFELNDNLPCSFEGKD